ncbi:penicillin-binding protein 1C [Haliscomenobacter sp.]|uniref:penicillin-binding protein 1C n=1 Tax=Haliscomenobacter sp. TaxID=2717303 RepID=UPI0035934E5F
MNRIKTFISRVFWPNFAEFTERLQLIKSLLINYQQVKPLGISLGCGFIFIFWYIFCLPYPLFDVPVSQVVEDVHFELLSARIAADGQWRFPEPDSIPEVYIQSLIEFEDQNFYHHQGVDPFALLRAVFQNLSHGRIVSGGSTISMQVIRMAKGNPARSIPQKMMEAILATRLEFGYSKVRILRFYAANAPFGGNVVGIEAAAWRYFGKSPALLSWAEGALLAVLPNSPALIHPGRNRTKLLNKRNKLLDRLAVKGIIDKTTCDLAKSEELPEAPHPLPRLAPHLLDRVAREKGHLRIRSSIQLGLQEQVMNLAQRHQQLLKFSQIHNLAILVADVRSGEVLAYVGNAPLAGAEHGEQVDIITAPRSSGSILKPFLYGLALQDGLILPHSLLPDVPMNINGYRPENFQEGYDGLVPAGEALSRSLNIPFVDLLRQYYYDRFHFQLKKLGMSTLTQAPGHYGLSLILGGAETKLWDLCGMYSSLARVLGHFPRYSGRYDPSDYRALSYLPLPAQVVPKLHELNTNPEVLSAGSIWAAFEAMQEVQRPGAEGEWQQFSTSRRVAWKTGTSFGFRDAWAIGVTPEYVVGVWAGNADGEGRPGLVGSLAAAPVLFETFGLLPPTSWFDAPYDDLAKVETCRETGFRAGQHCPIDTSRVPKKALNSPVCRFHQLVHLDQTEQYQVNAQCYLPSQIVHRPWLALPPLEEFYYRQRHPEYAALPPFHPDCQAIAGNEASPMQLIYPRQVSRIFVPIDLDGSKSKTIFQVAHRRSDAKIHWHIDQDFVGTTQTFHQFALEPPAGKHVLTLVDENGYRLEQRFEIILKQQRK